MIRARLTLITSSFFYSLRLEISGSWFGAMHALYVHQLTSMIIDYAEQMTLDCTTEPLLHPHPTPTLPHFLPTGFGFYACRRRRSCTKKVPKIRLQAN